MWKIAFVFEVIFDSTSLTHKVPNWGLISAQITFNPLMANGWFEAKQLTGDAITSSPGLISRVDKIIKIAWL